MVADPSKKTLLKIWLAVGLILGCAAVLTVLGGLIEITQKRILTAGVDNYQFHRPLFGNLRAAQDIVLENELRGMGVILVNLRRAAQLPAVVVTVSDPTTDEILAEQTILPHAIADDTFASVLFTQPISPITHDVVRISFTAPLATPQNPVGIRFHPDNPYPASSRLENDIPVAGDLAFKLHERVTLWQYIYTTVTQITRAWQLLGAIIVALGIALLSVEVGWQSRSPQVKRRIRLGILLLVAILAFASRAVWLTSFHGVSGGDPYNYLAITQQLAQFDNPFAISKRLPGFPLLLLPAYLTSIDDIVWMRSISITSAAIAVLLIALLARVLRLPWSVQLLAAVVLAIHKDFWWVSLRPEPYTFYAMLLLLALVLFFNLRTTWHKIGFGLVIGYAAMTRQEGFVVAIVFGIAAIIFGRYLLNLPSAGQGWRSFMPARAALPTLTKHLALMFGPALLLVVPFFVHNAVTYGSPLYTEYFEGDRLQIVDSLPAFLDSLGATWGVLGSMWRPHWDILFRVNLTSTIFLVAAALTFVWWFVSYTAFYRRSTTLRSVIALGWVALLCSVIWLVSISRGGFYDAMMMASAGVLTASLVPFLAATTWRGGIVVAIAFSQILIALWFHPFAKHYQQVYPLLVLLLVAAIAPSVAPRYSSKEAQRGAESLRIASRVVLLTPLLLVAVFLHSSLPTFIDKYNHAVALDNVVYRAVQLASQLPGPYGADQPYVPARLYLTTNAHYFFGDEPHTLAQSLAWIKEHHVRTLIDTNNNQAFKNPPAAWQLIKTFRAEGKDEQIFESRVYNIPEETL